MTVLIFECLHPPFHNPVEKTRSRTNMTSGPTKTKKKGVVDLLGIFVVR